MSLNQYDLQIFNEYFGFWLALLIFGFIGVACNIFTVYITLSTPKREIESFRYVLLNVELTTTLCLLSYTIFINQVYINDYTYYFGIFSLLFSINLRYQQIYQSIVAIMNIFSYCLYGLALYNHLIPPTSLFHFQKKSQRVFVALFHLLYIILIPKIIEHVDTNYTQILQSDYGFHKSVARQIIFLYTIICIVILILIAHMVYLFVYGPKLSKQTQKLRLLFIKIFIIMLSIPGISSLIITSILTLIIPNNIPWLVNVLRISSHLHMPLTNMAFLVFIKPLRLRALRFFSISTKSKAEMMKPKALSFAVSSHISTHA